jgi:hypothetical protein
MPRCKRRQFDVPFHVHAYDAKDVYRAARHQVQLEFPDLPPEAAAGLRYLLLREPLCQAFDQFDECDALMADFPMGHLHQMINLKVDPVGSPRTASVCGHVLTKDVIVSS